jgi:hypothetical protein
MDKLTLFSAPEELKWPRQSTIFSQLIKTSLPSAHFHIVAADEETHKP